MDSFACYQDYTLYLSYLVWVILRELVAPLWLKGANKIVMALTWTKISYVESLENEVFVSLSRRRPLCTRNKYICAIFTKQWQCSIFVCSLQFCLVISVAIYAGHLLRSCHHDTMLSCLLWGIYRYQRHLLRSLGKPRSSGWRLSIHWETMYVTFPS